MNFKSVIISCAITAASSASLFAQSAQSPYVFPEFVKANVLQKSGGIAEAMLDYNTITEEMMFIDKDNARLVLDGDNIDTVYIANRKFIPTRKVYFEKLTETSVPLFVQYKSKAVPTGSNKPAGESNQVMGMNGTAKKGELQKLTSYDLKLPENYTLKTENIYWVQKEGAFYPTSNVKKIIKFFPGKEAAIDAFVKENNISMSSQADMIKLINFCNK